MTIQQTKTTVNSFLAAAYGKIQIRQDLWFAAHKRFFQLPRFPYFPATDGSAITIEASDLDAEQDAPIPTPDPDGPYATEAVYDPFGICTSPGVLRGGRSWETAPVVHASLPYYIDQGKPAPLAPTAPASWRRLYAAISEAIPAALDFAMEVNVYRVPNSHPGWTAENRGWGWQMKAHVLWDARVTYWTRAKAEGPEAADRTWAWRQESVGTP